MVMKKDLTDIGDCDYSLRQDEFRYCLECEQEDGGTRGDFWEYPENYVFKCSSCGSENMILARRVSSVVPASTEGEHSIALFY